MKFNFNSKKVKRWIKFLNPPPKIGGLEITDTKLRYVAMNDGRVKHLSYRLSAGVIEGGKVKDKAKLISSLIEFHKQIGRLKKPINVVVSISASNVYTQIFNLPYVAKSKLEEAAKLNLQMISPIDVRSAYSDWEMVGETKGRQTKMELMGAFVGSKLINDLMVSLDEAGFVVVAVESVPLSLARIMRELSEKDITQPHLMFSLSMDGLDFFVLRNGKLYFNYFVSWKTLQSEGGGKLSVTAVKKLVVGELRRILNFYTSRWGGVIEDLLVVSSVSNKEVLIAIEENFDLKIQKLVLPTYPQLSPAWLVALGAALRGQIVRSKDIFISLAKVGTEEKFEQSRIITFASFWRNIIVTVLVSILVIFGVFDLLVAGSLNSAEKQLKVAPEGLEIGEIEQLENQAKEFNILVDKMELAKNQSPRWIPFFGILRNLAGNQIMLTQIRFATDDQLILVSGRAGSERAVINFKNTLVRQDNFEDVSLPLTNIKVDNSGRATFSVSFKLKKWPL